MRVAVCVCVLRAPALALAHALQRAARDDPIQICQSTEQSCGYGNNVWTSEASTARGAARTDENHRQ